MKFYIFLLGILLLVAGCKSTKNLSSVEESNIEFVMPELKSTINVHYDLNKQSLQDTFNRIIEQYLAGDMEITSMGMDVVIEKAEEAEMELSGRKVLSKLPIKLAVSKNTILNTINAEGVLELNFVTDVDIDSSWNLVTKTNLEHYEWTKEPSLSLGVFSIPVGKLANGIIEKSKAEFESQIDKSVNDQLSIREKVLDLLKYIENPIELDTVLNSWVTIIPEYVHMSEIVNYEEWFNGNVTIQGRTKISEEKPKDHIPGIRLPEFTWQKDLDDTSHVNFVLDISYASINKYLNTNYRGKTFGQDGRTITLNDIELYRKGANLVTRANVSGSVNGELYISGKPIFDNEKQAFYTDDVDIDLKTKNVLHRAGAWLLKGKIKNQLKQLISFSIEENRNSIQRQLDSQIEKYNIKDQLLLRADIKKLKVNKFVLGNEKIHSFVTINLFLKAIVQDMRLFDNDINESKLKN